ncbi:hypothetical protein Q8F55_009046 [Vanrija albida]|uniref:DUF974-domain-containing protein n=1 Tax=Vanrija albida TaxID=181172 RepID=A0ABR3PSI9_9TREE
MELPPLTFELARLSPYTLVPGAATPSAFDTVPSAADAQPAPPLPAGFAVSPTSNYPAPFGFASLGERLGALVRLTSAHPQGEPVRGVKMMLEVQSPSGRFRLGEVIHEGSRAEGSEPAQAEDRAYDELPRLEAGESVQIDAGHDIAELGSHILICSVAWETPEGRRTFQRFLKFTVNAPLAIKTRVHTATHPNSSLSPSRRAQVYLEVLMQNVSPAAMEFGEVTLNAVDGLVARPILPAEAPAELQPESPNGNGDAASLLPGDTLQRLFVLSPAPDTSSTPLSSFPPTYAAGTVLPLGRLDIAWISGPYRDPGRFQTSTLNRRAPAPPGRPAPSRPNSALGVPQRRAEWEFDLTLADAPREAALEDEFERSLRVAVRSGPVAADAAPPQPLQIGVQFLAAPPPANAPPPPTGSAPAFALQPPSRTATPVRGASASPAPARPFSPGSAPSRPLTPVSAQLRHAVVSNIASPSAPSTPSSPAFGAPPSPQSPAAAPAFPPAPVLDRGVSLAAKRGLPAAPAGRAAPLGSTLVLPPPAEWTLLAERPGTTYAAEAPGTTTAHRWEAAYEIPARYVALLDGLAELGGLRVLVLTDDSATAGSVGHEWESLGDVWIAA